MDNLFDGYNTPTGERFIIIEGGKEARDKYGHSYGSSGVVITEEDIQALKDGKQLVFDGGEYNMFIMLEKSESFPYGRCECGRPLLVKKLCRVCDNDE
jgi:hypothetical protein